MKYLFAVCLISFTIQVNAQDNYKKLPNVEISQLNGEKILTSSFENDGQPIVLSFWATWCKPCVIELNELQDVYDDWQEETGVKIIAISTDDSRSATRVPGFVNGKGWEFDVFLDSNSDFKRALNVNNIPHSFLIDGSGRIVWQHAGYNLGDEQALFEEILKLTSAKN